MDEQAATPFVIVSIDELVLEGFPATEKYRIGEAVQQELTRLFSESTREQGPVSARTLEFVDAGTFQMNGPQGIVIGAQIAQAVFESFQSKE